ncbi:MAG: hypothetical protein ACR2QK_02660, partial [Acidimicrobiales bacterium]
MSDTSTGLATTAEVERGPATGRWRVELWDETPPAVMLAEADRLCRAHRFRRAIRILATAAETTEGAERDAVLRSLATAAADGGRHHLSADAVYELQAGGEAPDELDADTWACFANVALARGNHLHADNA